MRKYIPLLYLPLMLLMIMKLNIEIDKPNGSIVFGFTRLGLMRYTIVILEVVFYVLLKKFQTPKYIIILLLGLLAFPQPLWVIANVIIKVFSIQATYLLTGPYTFVGMTLLSIEFLDLFKNRSNRDAKHFT